MMFDTKGCGLIIGIAVAISLFIGLLVMWFTGGPWWIPIVAIGAVPIGCGVVVATFGILWSASGNH